MRITRFLPLLCAFAAFGSTLIGAEGGFTATLSQAELAATGTSTLSFDEQAALNALIAGEVGLARQGNVPAFAGTFSSRRSDEERAASGLDRLSEKELAELDSRVAALIASGQTIRTTPRRLTADDVADRNRVEIHGEVSVMFGWGSGGRTSRGASFHTDVYDRETGLSIGVGISQFEGDGFHFYDDRYYGSSLATPFRVRGAFARPTVCRPR